LIERLEDFVERIPIVDSHEHIPPEAVRISKDADPLRLFLSSYTSSDLKSVGLGLEDYRMVCDPNIDIKSRWEVVEPYWRKASNTGYFRVLKIITRELYGIDEINGQAIVELARKMEEAKKEGLYKWILKDMAKIDIAIVDNDSWVEDGSYYYDVNPDHNFFQPVSRFEDFLLVRSRRDISRIGSRIGAPIHSLEDLCKALERQFQLVAEKIAGVKLVLAYHRSLQFDKVSSSDAEKVFNRIASSHQTFQWSSDYTLGPTMPDSFSIEETMILQNFMVHKILTLAGRYSLPVQIHTGIQEGNSNNITNSNPNKLVNLFVEYPEVKFDVFHGSYPYMKELGTLAKSFPNVYIDMCWLHIISPHAAREALDEWLDSIPLAKIIGFGGDYAFVEGAYGHSRMARKTISSVLRKKIEEGVFTEEEAKNVADSILCKNAQSLLMRHMHERKKEA
jgi:predicted TIM-barrel fold metal-dependent hydrolase